MIIKIFSLFSEVKSKNSDNLSNENNTKIILLILVNLNTFLSSDKNLKNRLAKCSVETIFRDSKIIGKDKKCNNNKESVFDFSLKISKKITKIQKKKRTFSQQEDNNK